MVQTIKPSKGLRGSMKVPGDKSISHRALIVSALAEGRSEIHGLSGAADIVSTRSCLESLGVEFRAQGEAVSVAGKGLRGLRAPNKILDTGNSGTTIRLLAGILAGQRFASELTGDASLQTRPMKRIIDPLTAMGATIRGTAAFTAPLRIEPVEQLRAIFYDMPVASAQVKSAILLAGLFADGTSRVTESITTRDHTERMLSLPVSFDGRRRTSEVQGGMSIEPKSYAVPGDISSAAYFIAAALLVPHSELTIEHVGLNPTRTAVLDVFRQMGGDVSTENERIVAGEPMGDIRVVSSELSTGFELRGARVVEAIDEIPILAVVAACSRGVFAVREAKELRAKESDRIKAIVTNLRALALDVEEYDDGFAFEGGRELRGTALQSFGDHRIAMASAVAGLRAQGESEIQDAECVDISFPGFWEVLNRPQL